MLYVEVGWGGGCSVAIGIPENDDHVIVLVDLDVYGVVVVVVDYSSSSSSSYGGSSRQ